MVAYKDEYLVQYNCIGRDGIGSSGWTTIGEPHPSYDEATTEAKAEIKRLEKEMARQQKVISTYHVRVLYTRVLSVHICARDEKTSHQK